MDSPTSVYPFIMHVIGAVKEEVLSSENAQQILEKIESFLVRRVVCGYEPTGLHAAFKSLWDDCEGNYSVENVVDNIKKHPTVKWPGDEEFLRNIKTRPLYKVRMTPYILAEWNGHLGGDVPILQSQQIEHVLPDTLAQDSQWLSDWTKEQHKACKECIANLLPISGSLNASIQNADYCEKKVRYSNDSALKAPREFAKKYDIWTVEEFAARAEAIGEWALSRWNY